MQTGLRMSIIEVPVRHGWELPGNHILARMSHEATLRSLVAGTDAAGGSALQRAEAVSHDWHDTPERDQICWDATSPQDCVDEALLESFPASDPPAYTHMHA